MNTKVNSEEFLEYYNRIDKFLRIEKQLDNQMSFSQVVKQFKDSVVYRYRDELISYGELRNAIVHTPKLGGLPIAEPHPETVTRISFLYQEIAKPRKVIPDFQFNVLGCKPQDSLKEILRKMIENSFSQIPVLDVQGHVMEILNTNTIARWLGAQIDNQGDFMAESPLVEELLDHIEFKRNYRFIGRNTDIYAAFELFSKQIKSESRNLDALFITDSGKESEKLLGLITIEDIANKVK